MSEKSSDLFEATPNIVHLPAQRKTRMGRRVPDDGMEFRIVAHYRDQSEKLAEQNRLLMESQKIIPDKVDRLTKGLDRLVNEMHGIRTGKREEAFARVGDSGCALDLPTVRPDAALTYSMTATEIGEELGFKPSEIGLLLSRRGLRWADNPDYQETTRRKRASQQRFWIAGMPARLAKILDQNQPKQHGITEKAVLAMFRKWHCRKP